MSDIEQYLADFERRLSALEAAQRSWEIRDDDGNVIAVIALAPGGNVIAALVTAPDAVTLSDKP